jgi:hypothetical protein
MIARSGGVRDRMEIAEITGGHGDELTAGTAGKAEKGRILTWRN